MHVYDFKGKGVAMSMYNTDEVRYPLLISILIPAHAFQNSVHHWIRPRFLQDGIDKEDAAILVD
jgi:hypothetical protein